MRIFQSLNIDFLGKRNFFYVVSASLFLLGFVNMIFRGLQFGIDFKGGTEIVLQFQNPIEISNIRNDLENIGLGSLELKTFGSETGVLIRTELQQIPRAIYKKVVANINDSIEAIIPGIPLNIADSSSARRHIGRRRTLSHPSP